MFTDRGAGDLEPTNISIYNKYKVTSNREYRECTETVRIFVDFSNRCRLNGSISFTETRPSTAMKRDEISPSDNCFEELHWILIEMGGGFYQSTFKLVIRDNL